MSDTLKNLTCPACNKEMTKIFLDEQSINVDICLDGCGGILFDNRELNYCDESHENIDEILEAIKNKTFTSTDESETRICPICEVDMLKAGAGIDKVQLDYCPVCGAKFLDYNELKRIREGKKDVIDSRVLELIDEEMKSLYKEVTLGIVVEEKSKFRQFFEDMVLAYLRK